MGGLTFSERIEVHLLAMYTEVRTTSKCVVEVHVVVSVLKSITADSSNVNSNNLNVVS